ncbi:hydroxymethylglutaryl-CoA lyase [Emiliania huxleyi CCMP1516]|uniref:hydroxymethylglutaryl-CoA lyase n=2 Tax=Emiliania huxleyi TaxID=2903 RepID=A0A0D3IYC0_EMIH1|nr:hydroxymethylglutaryl-CoA lyase [Emiliania huxleyi CCMP1516]EOD16255.1 hydroxymethylglutaryl-CoA lyase [Emiliania huxleyi CCMP1516]|eukprot:XP_005768684.1 hydroxymethylglutaryl-CoA lyase [Emiliania huxleyi CCMP1516]
MTTRLRLAAHTLRLPRRAQHTLARAQHTLASLPARVRIYELGARDGLQNEQRIVDAATKIELIHRLARMGASSVETTSFVSARAVPQMADCEAVMAGVEQREGTDYPVLVLNLKGFERAKAAGARSIAVMAVPSVTFARKNNNCTPAETVERAATVAAAANAAGMRVRGYVSCALGCPFEGAMEPAAVADLAEGLQAAGCHEVCLADTIGTGTPGSMRALLLEVLPRVPSDQLAVHCHDTYGQALANIYEALQHGVSVIDSSVAGLGGCPFAGPGASGNVATEDVVYMLDGLGIESGVSFEQAVDAGEFIVQALGRHNSSRAAVAFQRRGRPSGSAAASRPGGRLPGESWKQAADELSEPPAEAPPRRLFPYGPLSSVRGDAV